MAANVPLSIIIPFGVAPGREPLLATTVRNLQQHIPKDAEIIIVEERNNSSSEAWIQGVRWEYVEGNGRFNCSRTVNKGIAFASSDKIIIHDADLITPPDYIEKVLGFLDSGYEFVKIGSACLRLNKDATKRVCRGDFDPFSATKEDMLGKWNDFPGGSWGVTRGAFTRLGGLDEKMLRQWDKVFVRLAREKAKTIEKPQCVFVHLYHVGAEPSHESAVRLKELAGKPVQESVPENHEHLVARKLLAEKVRERLPSILGKWGEFKGDPRPECYLYWKQLREHIGDPGLIFSGKLVWPRQFEIHLPSNKLRHCNLNCAHCAGGKFDKSLGDWEITGLRLLDRLEGAIPFHIYGGAYTEPLLNPYFMAFLAMTKKHGNHFGIHTNASALLQLEDIQGWLHELNRISTDDVDYLSVALDGASPGSWRKTKGAKDKKVFWDIIEAIKRAVTIREKAGSGHAIRVTYLLGKHNNTEKHISRICASMRDIGVDSLRFAIPFAQYNQSFDDVREYRDKVETPGKHVYEERLAPHLSDDMDERPYIWWAGPEFTDIDKFNFTQCAYGYYQITYGADGYCYRCSTSATPTMPHCRLGPITDDVETFKKMVLANQNPDFDANVCFDNGARCNRMGLEICCNYAKWAGQGLVELRAWKGNR